VAQREKYSKCIMLLSDRPNSYCLYDGDLLLKTKRRYCVRNSDYYCDIHSNLNAPLACIKFLQNN
jgi:hypothetical protein